MNATSLKLALPVALLAIVFPQAGSAEETAHAILRANLEAKIHYCKDCHGQSAQGFSGAYPIPRLAGQTVPYLESKFDVMMEHKQDNPTADTFMVPVLGSVDPVLRRAVASHMNGLDPEPASDGPKDLVATGKVIYQAGLPESNVPACAPCHGAGAKGDGTTPRLAGQVYRYAVKVLTNWSKAHGAATGVKSASSHNLTEPQIDAVAAYLSYEK
ncbi:MAG: c-type cytochrome [Rhodomicrobium sp.]